MASDAGVHGEGAQTATIIVAFLALATLIRAVADSSSVGQSMKTIDEVGCIGNE